MGIDVKNREVFYNNTHQNGLNTSVDTNPHIMTVHKEIVVQSIFQRHKLDSGGDGNPFIYALKKSKYKISNKELLKFKPEFNIILTSVMQSKNGTCFLVPIPSSHKIASILARRASKIHNQCIVADIFSKKTNGEIASDLSQVKFSEDIKKEAIKLVSNLKRSKNATFTMKEVKSPKLRKHITPIKLHNKDIKLSSS